KAVGISTAADVALQPQGSSIGADELRGDAGAILSAVLLQTNRTEIGRLEMFPRAPGMVSFIELVGTAGPRRENVLLQRHVVGDAALRNHLLVWRTIRSEHDGIEQASIGENGRLFGDVAGPARRAVRRCAGIK